MKRFSKKLIKYYFISNIFYSIIIYFFISSNFANEETGAISDEFIKLSLLMTAIIYVILVIYSIIYYFKSGYELRENEIVCKRGVLFKKESILEYTKINAVNKKQGLIQRMFGLSTLTIDSGSTNTAHQAEIIIIEDDHIVDELLKEVKARQNGQTITGEESTEVVEKENLYKFTTKTKFLYTLLNSIGTFIIMLLLLIFISIFAKGMFENIEDWENGGTYLDFILMFIGAGLTIEAVIVLVSLGISFIQYHDFQIYNNDDSIEINYGLFTKHQNVIKLNRVKGIRINQGIIKRLFGFVTINLEAIGYSNTTNQNNNQQQTIGVLIPLCKLSEVKTYLDKILPKYNPEIKEDKTIKFLPFISYFLIFSSITFGLILFSMVVLLGYFNFWKEALIVGIGIIVSFILFVIFVLINQTFAYKNNGITISDDKVTIYRGGLTKEIAVVLKENIIGIEKITTYHRNKNGIHSYKIHFRSNAMSNTIKVNNISIDTYKKLLNLMTF